jgi:sarcosine oxidase subunit delta
MLLIHCPYCDEKRPEIEFTHAGEAHIARPTAKEQAVMSDEDWSKYMFIRDNIRGESAERWWHNAGCNMFFNAVRNTVTDKFIISYKMGQQRPNTKQIEAVKK